MVERRMLSVVCLSELECYEGEGGGDKKSKSGVGGE